MKSIFEILYQKIAGKRLVGSIFDHSCSETFRTGSKGRAQRVILVAGKTYGLLKATLHRQNFGFATWRSPIFSFSII
jgi:hypothetical protein